MRAATLLPLVCILLSAEPTLVKSDLFLADSGGYNVYRIPGLVITQRGTLLAYCEARKSGRGDWGAIDIFLRRSTDGGRTFSPAVKMPQPPGAHAKNPVALAQKLAQPGEVTYNNPVMIADSNGAVHFVFNLEYMRVFHARSDDDGVSWSQPVEITSAFTSFRGSYEWKVLATGPGHGIQLRSGRLLIPIWLSTGTGGHAHRPSVAATIYSDDHGKTWRGGEIALPDTPEFLIPNETIAAELSDGRVLLVSRSESKAHRKIVATSRDGATNWSPPRFHNELPEPICMAGLVRFGKLLLFSNPDNLKRLDGKVEAGRPRDRRNLTIRMSGDDAATWPVKRVLEPGWSGYSDLAAGKEWIYCLYERGAEGKAFRASALTLARFNLEWLTGAR